MAALRALLAALIALSVAVAPMTAAAAASAMSVEMSMAGSADMPCCPPDDCKNAPVCAAKCFTIVAIAVPPVTKLQPLATSAPSPDGSDKLREHVASPPTHPPPA